MDKLARCLASITLSFFLQSATAQDAYMLFPHDLNDTVSLYICDLRAGIADSVIRFDLPNFHAGDRPLLEHASYNSSHPNTSYIFYRAGGKTYVVHYYWIGRDGNKGHEHMSTPYHLPDDTLFTWFARHIETMKYEDIYPFMVNEPLNGVARYLPYRPLYSPVYNISFFTPEIRSTKYLSVEDMQPYNRQRQLNLNYEFNTHTRLYELFVLLELKCIELFSPYQ